MLGQFLDVLINSDRIVIYDGEDSKSQELYRGYVACFNYDSGGIDTSRRIAKTGLGCEIFRVAFMRQFMDCNTPPKAAIEAREVKANG